MLSAALPPTRIYTIRDENTLLLLSQNSSSLIEVKEQTAADFFLNIN